MTKKCKHQSKQASGQRSLSVSLKVVQVSELLPFSRELIKRVMNKNITLQHYNYAGNVVAKEQ